MCVHLSISLYVDLCVEVCVGTRVCADHGSVCVLPRLRVSLNERKHGCLQVHGNKTQCMGEDI